MNPGDRLAAAEAQIEPDAFPHADMAWIPGRAFP
jgi:hypothetical protein